MFAPPGVDSDSSGEEDYIPSPPSPPPPKPSLLDRILFSKSNANKETEQVKKMTPVQAAKLDIGSSLPKRKKVRIRLEDEEHPDQMDLLASPEESGKSSSDLPTSMSSGQGGHVSPFPLPSPTSPIGEGGKVGEDVLSLLQQILIETSNTYKQQSGPTATVTPINESEESIPAVAPNTLGLSGTGPPKPSNVQEGGQDGKSKKPGKLSLFSKMAELHSPSKASNQVSEASPTSTDGSAAPPYTSPIGSYGQNMVSQTPPQGPPARPSLGAQQAQQVQPQVTPVQTMSGGIAGPPIENTQSTQGSQFGGPSIGSPQQQTNPSQWSSGYQPPWKPYSAPLGSNGQSTSQPTSPLYTGLAAEYYLGGPFPTPAAYAHHLAPVPPQSAPPFPVNQTDFHGNKPTQAGSPGWGFNLSNVPSTQFTDWQSHWRPGQTHWQQSNSHTVSAQNQNRGMAGQPQAYSPRHAAFSGPDIQGAGFQDHFQQIYPNPGWHYHPPQQTQQPYGMSPGLSYTPLPVMYPPYTPAPWQTVYPNQSYTNHEARPTHEVGIQASSGPQLPQTMTTSRTDSGHRLSSSLRLDTGSSTADVGLTEKTTENSSTEKSVTPRSYEPLQSPRIVKATDKGFTEVAPHTQTQQTPPSDIAAINAKAEGALSPKKVSREELDKRKSEYDRLLRDRDERKAKEKAALGSSSPQEIDLAVGKAKEARKEDSPPRYQELSSAADGSETDRTVKLKQVDMLIRQKEKIKSKLDRGEIGKEEGKKRMIKLETSISELKKALTQSSHSSPSTSARQEKQAHTEPTTEGSSPSTDGMPSSRGLSQQDKGRKRLDKGKEKAPPVSVQADPDPKPDMTSQEGLIARLADLQTRKDQLKKKASTRQIDQDEAKAELLKIGMKIKEAQKALERVKRENEGVIPGPSSRPAISSPQSVSVVDKEGKKDIEDPNGAEMAAVQAQIERIKRKVKEKKIDPEKGERELANLRKIRDGLSGTRDSAPAVSTQNQPSEAKHSLPVNPAKKRTDVSDENPNKNDRRTELLARIERIKTKASHGDIEKEQARQEIATLKAKIEALNADAIEKAKQAGVTTTGEVQGGDLNGDGPRDTKSEDLKAQLTTAEIDRQIERIKLKVKEGSIDKEAASLKLRKLKDAREALVKSSDKVETGAGRAVQGDRNGQKVDDVKQKREVILQKRDKVKKMIKDGMVDHDKGKKEMAKLDALLKSLPSGPEDTNEPENTSEETKKDKSGHNDAQRGSGTAEPKGTVENKSEGIMQRMSRIKQKMKDGALDRVKGKEEMVRLQALLSKLGNSTSSKPQSTEQVDEVDPVRKLKTAASIGEGADEVEKELEENKAQIQLLKRKLLDVEDDDKKKSYEKTLGRLQEERTVLKSRSAALSTLGVEPGQKTARKVEDAKQAAKVEDELDEEAVLDPEILALVLAEEEADRVKSSSLKNTIDQGISSAIVDKSGVGDLEAGDPREVVPENRAQPKLPRIVRDLHGEDHPGITQATTHLAAQRDHRSSRIDKAKIPHKSSEDLISWSSALVSLASCIANDLLTRLIERHTKPEKRDWESLKHTLCLEILPRFLTALMIQRDLNEVLHRMIGEESSDSTNEFMLHLNRLQTYMSASLSEFGNENYNALSMVDKVLHLSRFLKGDMVYKLHQILHGWRKDGLNMNNILQTIKFVQDEVLPYLDSAQYSGSKSRKTGILDSLTRLLDHHISPERDEKKKPQRLSLPNSQYQSSGSTEASGPIHKDGLMKSKEHIPHPIKMDRDQEIPAHPSSATSKDSHESDMTASSESPHGVRQRLTSMLDSLRHRPSMSSPDSPNSTDPGSQIETVLRNPEDDQSESKSALPNKSSSSLDTHLTNVHGTSSKPRPESSSQRDIEVLLDPVHAPPNPPKTKVEHSLNPLHPPKTTQEAYHPPHTAPPLTLPEQTIEFITPSPRPYSPPLTTESNGRSKLIRKRSTTPKIPPKNVLRYPARLPPSPDSLTESEHHMRITLSIKEPPQERRTTIVRPPGPGSDVPGSKHHVVDQSALIDQRRKSVWSSDSVYSDTESYDPDSDGTVESDTEAKELLAMADSGPLTTDDEDRDSIYFPGPDQDQVERAKEVLFKK